jgi:hypothetical protein
LTSTTDHQNYDGTKYKILAAPQSLIAAAGVLLYWRRWWMLAAAYPTTMKSMTLGESAELTNASTVPEKG